MSPAAEIHGFLGPPARLLAAGASCSVYTDGRRVLRLAAGSGARLAAQAGLMRALSAAGVPTPTVLDTGLLPDGRAFSLEALMAGDEGGPSPEGWADLGRALNALHSLPHTKFGRLEDSAAGCVGVACAPADGLRTRLKTWPFDIRGLADQPLIEHAPDLGEPVGALEAELWQLAGSKAAVCHTDLHGGQLRWQGGRLRALLDFGDAAIGPPAWDIASVAFFHDWVVAGQVAQAAHLPCERGAALFGLLLAFHRANRAGQSSAKLSQAADFARSCLQRL